MAHSVSHERTNSPERLTRPGAVDGRGAAERPAAPRRVVPAYAVTGKRTRGGTADLPLETLVTATLAGRRAPGVQLEYRRIIEVTAEPRSVLEIAGLLQVPLGVARVLVGDLAEAGYVALYRPSPAQTPPPEVLGQLLDGLRARAVVAEQRGYAPDTNGHGVSPRRVVTPTPRPRRG
ncbi:hypothetical protein GCM10009836_67450 [Pseudonocardia ailaonensis]|uniref:DUF742 domain-containing protein n=1 Tax=Pseudonocardia ailaonensis TaxID=367279 RepID=A0ABN2NQC2_9PSEU